MFTCIPVLDRRGHHYCREGGGGRIESGIKARGNHSLGTVKAKVFAVEIISHTAAHEYTTHHYAG